LKPVVSHSIFHVVSSSPAVQDSEADEFVLSVTPKFVGSEHDGHAVMLKIASPPPSIV
jgi:hypothetical protein